MRLWRQFCTQRWPQGEHETNLELTKVRFFLNGYGLIAFVLLAGFAFFSPFPERVGSLVCGALFLFGDLVLRKVRALPEQRGLKFLFGSVNGGYLIFFPVWIIGLWLFGVGIGEYRNGPKAPQYWLRIVNGLGKPIVVEVAGKKHKVEQDELIIYPSRKKKSQIVCRLTDGTVVEKVVIENRSSGTTFYNPKSRGNFVLVDYSDMYKYSFDILSAGSIKVLLDFRGETVIYAKGSYHNSSGPHEKLPPELPVATSAIRVTKVRPLPPEAMPYLLEQLKKEIKEMK